MEMPPVLPTWTPLWAFDNILWYESDPTPTDDFLWPYVTPILDETYFIRSQQPFLSSDNYFTPWVLFQPADSACNGWDDFPEEISLSSFIRVKLLDVVSATKDSALVKIQVLEILPLTQIVTTFDPHPPPHMRELGHLLSEPLPSSRVRSAVFGDFVFFSFSFEGDLGEWVICQKWQSRWRLIALGEWGFHHDYIYVGQRLLNAEELCAFNLV
jgi:hypothetical protein